MRVKRIAITEARRDLCALVSGRLAGDTRAAVEITSRGRLVAVLLHPVTFRHIMASSRPPRRRDPLRGTVEILAPLEDISAGELLLEAIRRQRPA